MRKLPTVLSMLIAVSLLVGCGSGKEEETSQASASESPLPTTEDLSKALRIEGIF